MSSKLRLAVLGSTGSIGTSTLDVAARHPERIEVRALSAHSRVDELVAQCLRWKPRQAVVTDVARAADVRRHLKEQGCPTEVLEGPQALCEVATDPEVDAVMAAVVGAAGLPSCLAAARSGKRLLLANKEALVVGGAVFMQAVREGGATLIPIDSEHSAIFQCLPEDRSTWGQRVDHIILTASGGPFRQRDPASLEAVTPDEACAHPTWVMGRKISVDSATMMNKALEVIEARWLFDLTPERIRAVIHPQSIVHSMVVCRDQSVLAQMGTPDMRVPIAYGLAWPHRMESGASPLEWSSLKALSFEEADERRFPGLFLSWHALRGPLGSTAVLNAANEVAVERFLAGRIGFMDIYRLNARALGAIEPRLGEAADLEGLMELDQRVRAQVGQWANARTM
ncbi:MAG: 1-deoxy-D-xylulose-5-phosphate reductoisomerase [Betaproteobacteria bacterium]|nr:1-deoxy-D-xylulose-5-phosphate reductoisomerase [Betaproteobacteria bacterium]NBT09771.1 1-deoxy-D-xylulose-5-phosphate reductoisomerase [Betaproteobacteria bacterium]NBU49272.1 1-deoxy-D-xylulose-5-phosphate reductoisomerase [Betaproteobacteria bacterium]